MSDSYKIYASKDYVDSEIVKLSEEVENKAPAIMAENVAYYHDAAPAKRAITLLGNSFDRDPVRVCAGKNYVLSLYQYAGTGITQTPHDKRFLTFSGTLASNTSLYVQSAKAGYTDTEAIKGKRVRIITSSNVPVVAAGYNSYPPRIAVRNGSTIIHRVDCNTSDVFNNSFLVDIPADAENINIIYQYLESGVNLNGVEFFAGIYLADNIIVETNQTVANGETLEVTLPENVTEFDTMMHMSSQSVVVDTKKYVDEHLPSDMLIEKDLVYVSPEMFGAVGDNATDDAQALQDCVDYAAEIGVAVRGYGTYRTMQPITISGDAQNVYIHGIDYYGAGGAAVVLHGRRNKVSFDLLRAYGSDGGSAFELSTTAEKNALENDITIVNATGNGDAIKVLSMFGASTDTQLYYNVFHLTRVYSVNGNGIYMDGYRHCSENVFYGKSLTCSNGYGIYCSNDSSTKRNKFYNFMFERYCKNGLYGTVTLINCYSCELMDVRNDGDVTHGNMIVIPQGGVSNFVKASGFDVDYEAFDVSNAASFEDAVAICKNGLESGKTDSTAWDVAFAKHRDNSHIVAECCRLHCYISTINLSAHFPYGKLIAYFNHKGYVPDSPWYREIGIAEYHAKDTDNCFPTIFDIGVADCTIYLDDSYCAVGINEITIIQYADKKATVYAKDGTTVIFDGSTKDAGTYTLKCMMTDVEFTVETSSKTVTYTAYHNRGLYTGSNERWLIV